MKNILLLQGGGGPENDISYISAKFMRENLKDFNVLEVVINLDGTWLFKDCSSNSSFFNKENPLMLSNGSIKYKDENSTKFKVDYIIPCIHGYPGESGDLQSILDIEKIPYLGSGSESSKLAYNKISTKLWASLFNIPVVPFVVVSSKDDFDQAINFYNSSKKVFVKASSSGSSVGCYPVSDEESLINALTKSLSFSPYALVEKLVVGQEVEVAVYEYKNKVEVAGPGEIICPVKFYSYEEKYQKPDTKIVIDASISEKLKEAIRKYSYDLFTKLKLKDLSRIDFFIEGDNVYLNEINSFPGLTPISMFPKLMEKTGVSFKDFLIDRINNF